MQRLTFDCLKILIVINCRFAGSTLWPAHKQRIPRDENEEKENQVRSQDEGRKENDLTRQKMAHAAPFPFLRRNYISVTCLIGFNDYASNYLRKRTLLFPSPTCERRRKFRGSLISSLKQRLTNKSSSLSLSLSLSVSLADLKSSGYI